MNVSVSFTVPGLPIAQPRQRHAIKHGKAGAFVHNYTPKDAPVQTYKQAIQLCARTAYQGKPLEWPLYLSITAVWPGPDPGPRKQPRSRQWRPKRPDGDNIAKAVKDALNGVLWLDDAQVVNLQVLKVVGATGEQACTEIIVSDVT